MGAVVFLLGCGGLLFGLFVGLLIGSVILRAAVALANRFLGPPKPKDTFGEWDDWDSDEPSPLTRKSSTRVIPEPGLMSGMLVTFVLGVGSFVGYGLLAFTMELILDVDAPDEGFAVVLLFLFGLPFTGTLLSFLLTLTLPTTFSRAALVAFLHHFLSVIGVGTVGAVMVVAWYALGW